jgi:hypothetical protein
MYSINYIEGLVHKEKYNYIILKVLKVINLLIHLAIIFLIVMSVSVYENLADFDDKINAVKSSILQKRGAYKINQMEREWAYYYYRLLAIKDLNTKSSKYCYVFKELGQCLPKGDFIIRMNTDKGTNIELAPDNDRLRGLSSFHDYAGILDNCFAECNYLKNEVSVKSTKEEKIGGRTFSVLNLKI